MKLSWYSNNYFDFKHFQIKRFASFSACDVVFFFPLKRACDVVDYCPMSTFLLIVLNMPKLCVRFTLYSSYILYFIPRILPITLFKLETYNLCF